MPGEKVIEAFEREHPLGKELIQLLRVPADITELGRLSFSTDSTSATVFEGCFLLGLPTPDNIPDYAIAISGRNNCILVDKRRGIIVMGKIDSESGFAGFEINLQRAIDNAPNEGSLLLISDEVEKTI